MKRAALLPLAFLLLFAASARPSLAALDRFKDWEKSPEYALLATDDEKKEWKKIATDEEADRFVTLFWARRDPDLQTPRNEFRESFDLLVKKADELFALGRRRGALTERGKALILIGPPKSRAQGPIPAGPGAPPAPGSLSGAGTLGDSGAAPMLEVWRYERAQLPPWSDAPSLELKFQVEASMATELVVEGATSARKLEARAAEVALVNPHLKQAPVYKTKEQVAAEQKEAADKLAEASKGPALSDASRATLEGLAKDAPFGPLALLPLAYRDGATRLMAQVYAPAAAVGTGEGVRLLVLARDKDGKDAVRLDEAAGLRKTRADFFTDRSFRVAPGDYDVAAALVDASGKVLVSARRAITVPSLPAEFAASPLLIAVNDFPADAPKPDEPFTFSSRRFVVKGDGRLDPADGLSYLVRLYNPSVDGIAHTIALRRSVKVKPKGQPAIDVPTAPEEPAKVPEQRDAGALIVDIAGSVVESNLGQYFRPGDYELRVTVTDLTSEKKLEFVAPFTVSRALP